MFYSIGEVARMFGVNTSLIRYWEQQFDIIRPKKNKKGNRLFTPRDVDHFHIIYHLVKERGYTLKGAREKLSKNLYDLQRDIEIRKTLEKTRAFLQELKKHL